MSGANGRTRNVKVFFTGAYLTRETLTQEFEEGTCTPIPSPGQDIPGALRGKSCGTRRRNRDIPVEVSLPPRRRYGTAKCLSGIIIVMLIEFLLRTLERYNMLG